MPWEWAENLFLQGGRAATMAAAGCPMQASQSSAPLEEIPWGHGSRKVFYQAGQP